MEEAVYYIKKNAEDERKSFIGYLNQSSLVEELQLLILGGLAICKAISNLLASKIKYLQMYTDIMWRWHQMENTKTFKI